MNIKNTLVATVKGMILMLMVLALFGGFDGTEMVSTDATQDTAGFSIGVLPSASADDGICPDGKPGCFTGG